MGEFYRNIPKNTNTFVLKFNNMLYSIKIGDELSDWEFGSIKYCIEDIESIEKKYW